MIGEDKLIRFSGCAGGSACTIVLRGASSHLLDEAERSLHDALCVLTETIKETRVLCGGGCCEMMMACAVDKQIPSIEGNDESFLILFLSSSSLSLLLSLLSLSFFLRAFLFLSLSFSFFLCCSFPSVF
jgi:chaperonin GroEL (HSP60 family)